MPKSPLTKTAIIRLVLTIIGVCLGTAIYGWFILNIFSLESSKLIQWQSELGMPWGPLLIIALIITEVVLAPLPGGWLTPVLGYTYGNWWGFVYAYTGTVVGTIIAYELARYIGRPFVEAMVAPDKIKEWSKKLERSQRIITLLFVIPLFPSDTMSLLLGMGELPRKQFLKAMMIGTLPNIVFLTWFGNSVSQAQYGIAFGVVLLILVGVLVWKVIQNKKD